VPIEDRSVLSDEEKQRRLQELLLQLSQKSEGLPPGGPQNLISQRTNQIQAIAASGNVSGALKAAENLTRATDQVAAPDMLARARQTIQQAPEAAKTAIRVLECRVKEARAGQDAQEVRRAETELRQALDLADKARMELADQQQTANRINRLAMERSVFGFDHLVITQK
jgi:hypothetical protein